MTDPATPKLCLKCARAKLAQKPEKPCADCALLNVDPMAKIRANAAKPSSLSRLLLSPAAATWRFAVLAGTGQKPARATPWDRGE